MALGELLEERLTHSAIGAFYEVYNGLGFGFLEHVYRVAMERELIARGHEVGREVSIPVFYKDTEIARQRLDLVVDQKLILEIKSTTDLHPSANRQLLSYLRSTRLEVGLILHFGPKPTFHRLVHRNKA